MSFGDLRKSVGNALYRQVGRANSTLQNHRSLPVDVLENDTSYQVVFDAPGTEPDDVQVRYLEGNVKIRIDRFRQFRDGYEMRFPGRGMELDGEAELPDDAVVDPDAGTATLTENGTLRIDIPKDSSFDADADSSADAKSESESDTEAESTAEADGIAIDD
ncbi:Hsp20 family protein [Natronorubrum sp. JWXQ-INN-674]|uniref:Hsp20 family protein n=1 Tax=Natronorubrum halalkaliphilum TaxID=2691917 RepID=A0A6B0VHN1_9EURY|nr:Hsp20/alpha crystallin family protein [Natronorubrum halalkaliphilum]MXV61004.1 Hsp20 family protein [Natronorubrum halalkaliphilum]